MKTAQKHRLRALAALAILAAPFLAPAAHAQIPASDFPAGQCMHFADSKFAHCGAMVDKLTALNRANDIALGRTTSAMQRAAVLIDITRAQAEREACADEACALAWYDRRIAKVKAMASADPGAPLDAMNLEARRAAATGTPSQWQAMEGFPAYVLTAQEAGADIGLLATPNAEDNAADVSLVRVNAPACADLGPRGVKGFPPTPINVSGYKAQAAAACSGHQLIMTPLTDVDRAVLLLLARSGTVTSIGRHTYTFHTTGIAQVEAKLIHGTP